jgi:hypothetical protein
MSTTPSPLELLDLPGEERYAEFLTLVTHHGQVWTLRGEGGFIAFSDEEGRECFPFWPEPAYAEAAATDDWSDCRPEPLTLEHFMTRWLIGMSRDGRQVAVFPAPDGSGVVIDPQILLQDLSEELERQ